MGSSFGFMGPYERALQIKAYVDDLHGRQKERELRQQQFQYEMEDRKRRNELDDLQTRLALHSMGALPVAGGKFGDFEAAMGGRENVDTPVGRYALPSAKQQADQQSAAITAKTRAEALGREQALDQTDPMVKTHLPYGGAFGGLGGKDVTVRRSQEAGVLTRAQDAIIRAHQRKNPQMNVHYTQPGDGTVHVIGTDKATGDTKELQVLKGAGKVAKPQKSGISSSAMRAMQNAQKAIDAANAGYSLKDTRSPEQKWKAAAAAVQQAAAAYPDELEMGPGDLQPDPKTGGIKAYPWIQPRKGAKTTEDSGGDQQADTSGKGVTVSTGADDEPPDTSDEEDDSSAPQAYAGHQISRDKLIAFASQKGVHPSVIEQEFLRQGGQVV